MDGSSCDSSRVSLRCSSQADWHVSSRPASPPSPGGLALPCCWVSDPRVLRGFTSVPIGAVGLFLALWRPCLVLGSVVLASLTGWEVFPLLILEEFEEKLFFLERSVEMTREAVCS